MMTRSPFLPQSVMTTFSNLFSYTSESPTPASRGSQRDVVYLGISIAPSYMSPNNLWRSNSIFNWCLQGTRGLIRKCLFIICYEYNLLVWAGGGGRVCSTPIVIQHTHTPLMIIRLALSSANGTMVSNLIPLCLLRTICPRTLANLHNMLQGQ